MDNIFRRRPNPPRSSILFIILFCLALNCACSQAALASDDNSPGARWGHVFVYDPVRDQILLFGGARERGSYLNDTWTWDGGGWQSHDLPGPSSRGFSAVTFHEGLGKIILHGGRGNDRITYSDTWEWNGSVWRQIEQNSPFKVDHHEMVYMKHANQILAFGGWNGQDVSGETWIWDGSWKQAVGPGPPKRAAFAMAYDEQEKGVVLFGGLWVEGQYADLWKWRDHNWLQLGGPYDNSSLDHHAMVYDSVRRQLFLFGGKNYRYVLLNHTQTINENRVTSVATEGPTPRHSIGFTYDSRRGQVVLYGGKEYQGELQLPLGDFWRWDGKEWRNIPD